MPSAAVDAVDAALAGAAALAAGVEAPEPMRTPLRSISRCGVMRTPSRSIEMTTSRPLPSFFSLLVVGSLARGEVGGTGGTIVMMCEPLATLPTE